MKELDTTGFDTEYVAAGQRFAELALKDFKEQVKDKPDLDYSENFLATVITNIITFCSREEDKMYSSRMIATVFNAILIDDANFAKKGTEQ